MSSGSTRARIGDLTDTQRRVLDLIAEGKTNHEIGQALGITLDGAKYHVTEILNKLGVESREEAAGLVGAPQRRFPTLRRPSARRVLATAAGIGAVGLAVGIVIALLVRNESAGVPAIQAAFIRGQPGSDAQRIVVVDADGGTRELGVESSYGTVYWSPDARHLMALEVQPPVRGVRVWIIDSESGESATWEAPGFEWFEWSPNGGYLVVVVESFASIVDTSGREVATFSGEFRGAWVDALDTGSWSPDSSRVALITPRAVAVLAPDGSQQLYPLPVDEQADAPVFFLEWLDTSSLRLTLPRSSPDSLDTSGWLLNTNAAQQHWEPATVRFEAPLREEQRALVQAVAGPEALLNCAQRTAEKSGWAWAFMSEDGYLVAVVVERDGELTRIEAPDNVSSISARPCVSVVLAP